MKNEFLEALGSNNANNNTDLSLYSRFVGNWSFTMTTYDEEGKIEDTKEGEWLFSYVMDGQRKILYTEIMEQQYEFQ